MSVTFRPARREHTPIVAGFAGPTKSGKTLSSHRVSVGLAQGRPVAMINAEGAKGHQYADRFDYLAYDIEAPFTPERYTEALRAALALTPKPGVVIIDSMSHMHDGPGGLLEYHEAELDRMAGNDFKKRDRMNWTAWIRPKAAENQFIYELLSAECHVILCFRAKEKLKIVKGAEPIDLGYQPIASDRISFETLFTLLLPPHCKGVPDLALSEMRDPFDKLIPPGEPLSETTGELLAKWAAGGGQPSPSSPAAPPTEDVAAVERELEPLLEQLSVHDPAAVIASHRATCTPDEHVAWLHTQIRRAIEALQDGAPGRATSGDVAPPADGSERDDTPEPAPAEGGRQFSFADQARASMERVAAREGSGA